MAGRGTYAPSSEIFLRFAQKRICACKAWRACASVRFQKSIGTPNGVRWWRAKKLRRKAAVRDWKLNVAAAASACTSARFSRGARRVSKYSNISASSGTAHGPRRACAKSSGELSFCVDVTMPVMSPFSWSAEMAISSDCFDRHQAPLSGIVRGSIRPNNSA